MNDCPFTLVAGRWTCPDCGWVYRRESEKPPRRNCPKAEEVRSSRFAVRSEDEIAACREVCQTCEHFAGNHCLACRGCKSEAVAVYESHLRVGKCPRGRWALQNAILASQ
jgi:hypothetical protein